MALWSPSVFPFSLLLLLLLFIYWPSLLHSLLSWIHSLHCWIGIKKTITEYAETKQHDYRKENESSKTEKREKEIKRKKEKRKKGSEDCRAGILGILLISNHQSFNLGDSHAAVVDRFVFFIFIILFYARGEKIPFSNPSLVQQEFRQKKSRLTFVRGVCSALISLLPPLRRVVCPNRWCN